MAREKALHWEHKMELIRLALQMVQCLESEWVEKLEDLLVQQEICLDKWLEVQNVMVQKLEKH